MSLPSGQERTDYAASESGVPGVVLDEPQQLVGHTILGRFRVDGVLGVGGMGAVLRCHHLGLQRDIAVKVLHPTMSGNREISARFAREAQTMSRMTHPNCARVLDFGEFDFGGPSLQYLAMELLEGCELSELMLRPLSADRAMALLDQILAGLEHAHAAGVVHRDLKPENVFVTTDHEGEELLKIVDFGIAKVISGQGAKDNMTVAGTIFGTPSYMSPEQCAGGEIDERTDVYAAGIILYEMLVGQVPFDDPEDPTKVLSKHIFEPVPELPASVPAPLASLLGDMLEKEKAQRLPSMEAARVRIAKIQRDLASGAAMSVASATLLPSANAASLMGRPSVLAVVPGAASTVSRPPLRWLIAGAAAVVLLGVIGWSLAGDSETAPPETTGVAAAVSGAPEKPEAAPLKVAPAAAPLSSLIEAATGEPQADADALAKLDAMIADKAFEPAGDTIRGLLDEYPKDAQVHLRKARVLRETDASKALAAYAQSLELDRGLLAAEGTREEILALMRRPEVADAAIDLAIRQLGDHGLDYLVERVNDDARPTSYNDRHRVIGALNDANRADDIDAELNTALDLWQASDATDPCEAYGDALDAVEDKPVAYYLGSTMRSTPPRKCAGLKERRDAVGAALQEKFAIGASDWVVPAAYAGNQGKSKKGKGRGRFRIFR